jgi:Ni,Fe-hydrogenase I cytochrome b subunit
MFQGIRVWRACEADNLTAIGASSLDNVRSSKSHNPKGLHSLLHGIALFFYFIFIYLCMCSVHAFCGKKIETAALPFYKVLTLYPKVRCGETLQIRLMQ